MKHILITVLMGIMSLNLSQAQEGVINSLELTVYDVISYQIDGVEQIDSLESINIYRPYGHYDEPQEPDSLSNLYEIAIAHIDGRSDYYRFSFTGIKETPKRFAAKFDNIDIASGNKRETYTSNKMYTSDKSSRGTIKGDLNSKLITAEMVLTSGEYAGTYRIIWISDKLDDQSFLKVGEPWEVNLDNGDNDCKWEVRLKPTKGFSFVRQYQIDESSEIRDDGIRYGRDRKNAISGFYYIAERPGKYKLTFKNGTLHHKFEITVLE